MRAFSRLFTADLVRRFALCGAVTAAGLGLTATGATGETPPSLLPPVALAVSFDYPPYVDRTYPDNGLAAAIVTEAFRRAGRAIRFVDVPWTRAYEAAKAGTADATFPWAQNAERARDMLVSAPLYDVEDQLFSMESAPRRIDSLADLDGVGLCRPLSFSLFDLKGAVESGRIRREAPVDMAGCFRMLAAGRVNVVWAERSEGLAAAHAALGTTAKLRTEAYVPLRTSMHLLATRASPSVARDLARFNEALASMEADGTRARIQRDQLAILETRLATPTR